MPVDYKIKPFECDNAIFEAMRLRLVALGYLPDFVAAGSSDAYNTAKAAIITGGKRIIEVISTGSWQSKGEKNNNNIIIVRGTPKPAQLGKGQGFVYDDIGGGVFNKYKESDTLFTIPYQISFSTDTQEYADIIEDVIRFCFSSRAYLTGMKDDETASNNFWFIQTGQFDTSGVDFIEHGFSFEARDIDLIGAMQVGTVGKFDFSQFNFQTTIIRDNEIGHELVDIPNNQITNSGNQD